jgi:hypothetical protein
VKITADQVDVIVKAMLAAKAEGIEHRESGATK